MAMSVLQASARPQVIYLEWLKWPPVNLHWALHDCCKWGPLKNKMSFAKSTEVDLKYIGILNCPTECLVKGAFEFSCRLMSVWFSRDPFFVSEMLKYHRNNTRQESSWAQRGSRITVGLTASLLVTFCSLHIHMSQGEECVVFTVFPGDYSSLNLRVTQLSWDQCGTWESGGARARKHSDPTQTFL